MWAFYEIARYALVALIPPPTEFADRIKPPPEQLLWAECELFRNVRARDIAASLIMKALARRLTKADCLEHPNPKLKEMFYLPGTQSSSPLRLGLASTCLPECWAGTLAKLFTNDMQSSSSALSSDERGPDVERRNGFRASARFLRIFSASYSRVCQLQRAFSKTSDHS